MVPPIDLPHNQPVLPPEDEQLDTDLDGFITRREVAAWKRFINSDLAGQRVRIRRMGEVVDRLAEFLEQENAARRKKIEKTNAG